ncbi:MAG TPA: lysylphosphatidylglycerol synthase transmembrane domain-containing protein [Ktedonobacterales bacterium]
MAITLLLVFAKLVNLGTVWKRLEHLDIGLALLCGIAFLSAYVVRAVRWRLFLAESGHRPKLARVVMIYQVAMFVNWLLPVRGGELVKSLLLRRLDDIPISESLSTVAMDKVMDLVPAVALVALLPFLPFQLSRPLWSLLLLILFTLIGGAAFLALAAWRKTLALRALHWLVTRLPRSLWRIEPFIARFVDLTLALAVRPFLLLRAALLTAVAIGLDALFCLLAFAAVGTQVPFPIVLFGYTLFNLAFILPTPPGQIGSNELIGLLIFHGAFGVGATGVAAMFLFSHPWTALLMAVSGTLCLSAMGLSMRSALTLTRSSSPEEAAR